MTAAHPKLSIMWIEDQIEDFIAGRDVLYKEMQDRGYEIDDGKRWEAKTVEEAERTLYECETSGHKPDVILLDLMLPQDNEDLQLKRVDLDAGYLIWFEIRHMKKWPTLSDVPILIITARGRPEYRDQVNADPGTRWLSKPADPSKVAEGITELLPHPSTAQKISRKRPQKMPKKGDLTPKAE